MTRLTDKIEIRLFLRSDSGKQHGVRYWDSVPRVGDQIKVKISGDLLQVPVRQVIWGDDPHTCVVALILDR